jgi:hypothetical protein
MHYAHQTVATLALRLLQGSPASLLFAGTSNTAVDGWTLPLAFAGMGMGGNCIHLSGFSLANLWPAEHRGSVTGIFVSVFSLSGFTFQLLYLLFRAGLSSRALFGGLAALQGVNLMTSLLQWPEHPIQPGQSLSIRGGRVQVEAAVTLTPVQDPNPGLSTTAGGGQSTPPVRCTHSHSRPLPALDSLRRAGTASPHSLTARLDTRGRRRLSSPRESSCSRRCFSTW